MSHVVSDTLARLLAMENLRVEHRKIPTAFFDLEQRILALPIFKTEMSKDVYDLLIGHEIGHALETPKEGWHNAILSSEKYPNKGRGFKSFLNVVEDARIERLVKTRYPGLRKIFHRGYQDLFDKNFFGDISKNPEKLLLIDRINLYYKVGALTMVTFSEKEERFLARIDAAKSWSDVEKIAIDLYHYCADELEEQQEAYEDLMYSINSDEDDSDEEKMPSGEDLSYDEPESLTDKAFHSREEEFIDELSIEVKYVNLPQVDPLEHIIPYKTLLTNYRIIRKIDSIPSQEQFEQELFRDFQEKNSRYINYLVKEFELKKNASQQARAKQNRTGVLDVNRLYRYKFDDQVFKSITTIPGGKNHGLVMFVDWSGSMRDNMAATVEQLLVLVYFCKKVNIPFEVFAFLSYQYANRIKEVGTGMTKMMSGDLKINNHFSAAQILSSDMKRSEFADMVKQLLVVKNYYTEGHSKARHMYSMKMSLGNTPLNETIWFARYFVDMYKKQKKLDIVNTVVLSDGEGSLLGTAGGNYSYNPYRLIYVDPITKKQIATAVLNRKHNADIASLSQLKAFVELTKECTGSRMIGFYILDKPSRCAKFFPDGEAKYEAAIRRDKFAVSSAVGFDEYYFIRGSKNLEIADEELTVDAGASKIKLLSAFKKNQNKKIMNRVILNRFISQIS